MTDRYFALTVLLDQDIRKDDAEPIINAIRMIKHVLQVEPHVSDVDTWAARACVRGELKQKLWDVLR